MNRRDAIARVGLLFGGTVIGAEAFLTGCTPKRTEEGVALLNFSPEQITLLDEIGETILPTTASSPGAKAAGIGQFMKAIVTDCYEEKDQKIFMEGINSLNSTAQAKYSNDFVKMSPEDRHNLLVTIDNEAKEYKKNKKNEDPNHYFSMVKQLTLWGYFTSEVGSRQALRYEPLPGKYIGCYPYQKGDKAWSAI